MKRFDSMNVIPLIDVMLVLLAIVLLTASFIVHDKLDIELPQTQHTQSYQPDHKPKLNMALNQQGQIFWDNEVLSLPQIDRKLAELDRATFIQLKVDQTVEFRHFVSLIDVLKHHQHDNLTILTERQSP